MACAPRAADDRNGPRLKSAYFNSGNFFVQGVDALREACLAGHGLIRTRTCNVDDELRMRKLVPVLSDWTCVGSVTMVAIYRKTRPMLPQVNVFVRDLVEALRHYDAL